MPPRDSLRIEQEHHKRAFETYYAQGGQRTYAKVAKELGVSGSAVKLWSRSWGWPQRIAERDASAARQIADQTLQSTIGELSQNKRIVRLALMKLAKAIANGQIKMQLTDLDRMIRLQSFLDGYEEGHGWESLTPEALAERFGQTLRMFTDEELIRLNHALRSRTDELKAKESEGGGTP